MTISTSDPSVSVDFINVPEPYSQKSVFTYNYYLKSERVNENRPYPDDVNIDLDQVSPSKLARYNTVTWQCSPNNVTRIVQKGTIERNKDKIVSEDNFFDPGYLTHTFSNISAIEQGASDLENYSRLSNYDAESMMKMARFQFRRIVNDADTNASQELFNNSFSLSRVYDAYSKLADLPSNTLGLRVYNENNVLSDRDDLIRSITESITLGVKINNAVVPDVFRGATLSNPQDLNTLTVSSENALSGLSYSRSIDGSLFVTITSAEGNQQLEDKFTILGYTVDKYIYKAGTGAGSGAGAFIKKKTFYIDGAENTTLVDKQVLYGVTYFYVIKTVASVKLLMYDDGTGYVNQVEMYVASRGVTTRVDTFEYVPPPYPTEIKFNYDYSSRKMRIDWKMPVNPQNDIKQFQIFRRKSIKHPFELIAQYGFDDSVINVGDQRYKTGEDVDANNYENMRPDLKRLVKQVSGQPVYSHVDEDFVVDSEFYESSDYIYALCSVDAHGLISNYSTQYRVIFDSYKNKIVSNVVCDSGCPKQYPNLNLKVDTFKDSINVSGDNSKKLTVYFSPEYLSLQNNKRRKFKVVEAQNQANQNSYYVLQMINLDNQKMQQLKIVIDDPDNVTSVI